MNLALILAGLLVLDAATTLYVLSKGGSELNPVLRFLIERIGANAAVIGSHAIGIAALYYWPLDASWLLILNAVFAVIVVRNLLVIRKLKSNPPA